MFDALPILTEAEVKLRDEVDSMTRLEMAKKWRFGEMGDPMLQGVIGEYFSKRFSSLGGFSPEISKAIGWGEMARPGD